MKRYIIHTETEIHEQEGDEHSIYDDLIIILKNGKPVTIINIKNVVIILIENI
jgi:hypothetical protein